MAKFNCSHDAIGEARDARLKPNGNNHVKASELCGQEALVPNGDCHPEGNEEEESAYLNSWTKAGLPTMGAPKVMQRTSAVGHCNAAHGAASVAIAPPLQYPVHRILRGVSPSAVHQAWASARLKQILDSFKLSCIPSGWTAAQCHPTHNGPAAPSADAHCCTRGPHIHIIIA